MTTAARSDAAPAPPLRTREVVSFLDLTVAQLELALRESEAPAGTIAAAVGALACEVRDLEQRVPEAGPQLREAVVALQFYDRLSQRLTHLRDALILLAGALQSPADCAGQSLHERVRRQYSMEQERRIFELAAAGAAPEEFSDALAQRSAGAPQYRVELF